jgi:hypothetical protein
MEKQYWLRRSSVASMMAREATSAEARLIHYDLAGRYSVKAWLAPPERFTKPGPVDRGGEDRRHGG